MNQDIRYVILINRIKDYTPELIKKHVDHLIKLEKSDTLLLSGPFKNYPGGIVIIKADSFDAAKHIAESDPFVSEGYSDYEIRTLEISNRDNNHLGVL